MIKFSIDFLEPRTGLEPVTLLALPTELTRHICGNTTPTMTAALICCLSDFRENKASRSYLSQDTHKASPVCRTLSQLHSLHWANFTAQRNCFYTGRSDNTSWLFFKLHLTTTLLLTRQTPNQRAIDSKLLKKSHLASWHQDLYPREIGSSPII